MSEPFHPCPAKTAYLNATEPESKYDMSQRVISPKPKLVSMNRRVFLRTTAGATVALTGCLGGGGDDEQQVDNEPQGQFTVVRDAGAGAIEITVDDPMNSDHAAVDGDHSFSGAIVMENISEGDSLTLSVEDGEIAESGNLEIFAIRGDVVTTEEGERYLLEETPDEFTSIEDEEDNPFSYDFSDAVGD